MEVAALGIKVESSDASAAAVNLDRLTAAAGRVEKATTGVRTESQQTSRAMQSMDKAARNSADSMATLAQRASATAAALGVVLSVNALRNYADGWSDLQSKVGAAIKDMSAAPAMMRRMVDIANASYSPLNQTIDVYTRNVSALADLGLGAQAAADFTEALNHSLVITATKGEQAASVQNALAKAMAIGSLSGYELNAVLTNGGRVAESLAKELGTTVNGLRQMSAEGKITSSVIANALLKSLEDVRKEAGDMPATIGDAFVRVQTNITELIGRLDQAGGASSAVAESILKFADGIRTAGDYLMAFGHIAAPVFNAVGSAASYLAEYSDYAIAAIAGFAAPALIGGVWALAAALATGVGGALKLVIALMMANPIGLLVGALAVAAVAVYKFRDDIKDAIGIDVVDTVKRAANFVIGSFVAAYEDIKFVWSSFGDMMGAAVIGGVNLAIRSINALIGGALSSMNVLIAGLNMIPGVNIGALGGMSIGEMDNPYAGRLSASVSDRNLRVASALQRDYIGALSDTVNAALKSTQAQDQLAGATGKVAAQTTAAAKASKAAADAYEKWAESVVNEALRQVDSLEKTTKSMEEQLATMGMSRSDLAQYRASRLDTAAAAERHAAAELAAAAAILKAKGQLPEVVRAYEQLARAHRASADQLERQSKLTLDIDRKQDALDREKEIADATKSAQDEWQKTADQINQSLTDALLRGFEDGKGFAKNFRDTLKNLFQTLVLRPLIQPIVSSVGGALTMLMGGPATAGGGGGLLGLASNASSLYSMAGALMPTSAAVGVGNAVSAMGITDGLSGMLAANGAFGTAGGGVGSALGLGGALGAFGTGLSAGVSSLMAAGVGGWASAAGSLIGSGSMAGAAAGLGMVAAPIAAVAAIAAAFGAFRKTVKRGDVLTGTLGVEDGVRAGDLMRKDGSLFSGPKWFVTDRGVSPMDEAIQAQWKLSLDAITQWSEALGLSTDKIEGFTFRLGSEKLGDKGAIGLRLDKDGKLLSDEEIQAKVSEAIRTGNNALAQELIGTLTEEVIRTAALGRYAKTDGDNFLGWVEYGAKTEVRSTYTPSEFARPGEEAIDTLTRLGTSLLAANAVFKTLGNTIMEASLASGDLASKLMDAVGGTENFGTLATAFMNNYYSDAERRDIMARQIGDALSEFGVTLPGTMAEYRALYEATQTRFAEGDESAVPLLATLLQLGQSFKDMTDLAGQLASAWDSLTNNLMDQVRKIRGETAEAEGQGLAYWRAQFAIDTAAARAGDQDAAGRLTGISDSLLQAAVGDVGSLLELQQTRAWVAQSLQDTSAYLAAYGAGGVVPIAGGAVDPASLPPIPVTAGGAPVVVAPDPELLTEVRALRDDARENARVMADLQIELNLLMRRWDRDGVPTREAEE